MGFFILMFEDCGPCRMIILPRLARGCSPNTKIAWPHALGLPGKVEAGAAVMKSWGPQHGFGTVIWLRAVGLIDNISGCLKGLSEALSQVTVSAWGLACDVCPPLLYRVHGHRNKAGPRQVDLSSWLHLTQARKESRGHVASHWRKGVLIRSGRKSGIVAVVKRKIYNTCLMNSVI